MILFYLCYTQVPMSDHGDYDDGEEDPKNNHEENYAYWCREVDDEIINNANMQIKWSKSNIFKVVRPMINAYVQCCSHSKSSNTKGRVTTLIYNGPSSCILLLTLAQ